MKPNPNQPDRSQFSAFELERMWSRLCQGIAIQREIEARHNAQGIFYEKGPDGKYRAVRREPCNK